MKAFLFRNLTTYWLVSVLITICLIPRFRMETPDEIFPIFLSAGFYVSFIVLLYGVSASILSEILSKSIMKKENRLLVKAIVYCLSISIFALQSPPELLIYAVIRAVFYYSVDEFIRKI
ncbi:hypothetical protein ACVIJU_002245 [Aeribacillus sp. SP014]